MADLDAFEDWLNHGGREEERRIQEREQRESQASMFEAHIHRHESDITALMELLADEDMEPFNAD